MPMHQNRIRQPHRDYYEIIKQILQAVYTKAEGCRSFELAFRCELTWDQFKRYRDVLLTQKLLILSNSGPNEHYEITPRGERYLPLFGEIEGELGSV
jgi:predicted transcriptional regulator